MYTLPPGVTCVDVDNMMNPELLGGRQRAYWEVHGMRNADWLDSRWFLPVFAGIDLMSGYRAVCVPYKDFMSEESNPGTKNLFETPVIDSNAWDGHMIILVVQRIIMQSEVPNWMCE